MNPPNPVLRTRVALVTGASRGIGRAIGERLAADGYHAVLTYRADAAGAEAAAAAVRAAGGSAEAVKADVTSAADIAALADRLDREREGVDVLVNNAAVLKNGLFALMPDANWNLVLDTALGGTYRMTKAVMRGMLRRRWGRIVNISSVVGLMGNKGQTNYAASKAGLIGLTKSVAKELASRNILCNAIAPVMSVSMNPGAMAEEARTALMAQIPLARLGTPADIAWTTAFLCSEYASYITGQVLVVDGGLIM